MHDNDLILAAIVGTIVFFILAAFSISYFLIFKRRRKEHRVEIDEFRKKFETQLLHSRIEVQEQTFQHIGKELHDNVSQLLGSSRMLLGITERNLQTPPETLLAANATLGKAINELRSLSKSLDKDWLEQFSFTDNLRTEIERIRSTDIVNAVYEEQHPLLIKPEEQIILFRIVQEAMQNAIKHAQPAAITVSCKREQDTLILTITDNGKGFDHTNSGKGMGVDNMKQRTLLLRGTINWNSAPGQGTTVTITLPFPGDSY